MTDNNESVNKITTTINKGGRPSKNLYKKEQEEILKKLLDILEITDKNTSFFIEDLDANTETKNKILSLKDDAHKYFISGKWSIFAKKNIPKPWLSLAKSILKASGYTVKGFNVQDNITRKNFKHGIMLSKPALKEKINYI